MFAVFVMAFLGKGRKDKQIKRRFWANSLMQEKVKLKLKCPSPDTSDGHFNFLNQISICLDGLHQ
jgi:hypothetical protein